MLLAAARCYGRAMTSEREAHQRYLDYRDRFGYFGAGKKMLSREEFTPLEEELDALEAKGEDGRDDEEEARFVELCRVLLRD